MKLIRKLVEFIINLFPTTNIITFASYPDYTDNAYAVFQYIRKKKQKRYKLYWLIEESSKVDIIQKEIDETGGGAVAVSKKSLRGIWIFLRCRYNFTTHGIFEKIHVRQKPDKMVSLWHGMPIKGIGTKNKHQVAVAQNQDLMVASSEVFQKIMSECFNISIDKVLPIGQPRCDMLFEPTDFFEKRNINRYLYSKVGIWLPTYRMTIFGSGEHDGDYREGKISFLDEHDLSRLDSELGKINQLLIIKLHPMDLLQEYEFGKYNNILIIKQKDFQEQLYPLLGSCDYLLSDYSSVSIDYDVCRKPMGFVLDDADEYGESRGFIFDDITEVLPGTIIRDYQSLVDFINNPQYKEAKICINKYYDNKATERLLDYLGI